MVSTMDEPKRKKRTRRSFTDEFKASAVRLVLVEGKSIPEVARDLDLTESAFRGWVERVRADRTDGPRHTGMVDATVCSGLHALDHRRSWRRTGYPRPVRRRNRARESVLHVFAQLAVRRQLRLFGTPRLSVGVPLCRRRAILESAAVGRRIST
jgi:transposase-like protein